MHAKTGPIRRKAEAGVTLVEILVVLSIIAITTGAAMLRLGIGRAQDDLTNAAAAMALAVTEASDAALASGQDRVLELGPQGYRVGPDGSDPAWRQLSGLGLASAGADAGPWRLSADAASTPFGVRLSSDAKSVQVRFDGLRATVEAAP